MTDMRLLILGIDCGTPQILFDHVEWAMPTLRGLMARGTYGILKSVVPAITVPAWACMMTGKDPGELGIYGFRNRIDHTYTGLRLATSQSVVEPAVWDDLGRIGKRVVTIAVPPSFPPKPVNGYQVGCFLTPSARSEYTFPLSLRSEIDAVCDGEYLPDCPDFRVDDKDKLIRQLYDMTERRFQMLHHLIEKPDWDFFMSCEIATDRLHHGFWKYYDPMHRDYVPGNKYENVIRKYYEDYDAMLGALLARVDQRRTNVYVVSDHGAKRMDGGLAINEWLIREGYLVLNTYPTETLPFAKLDVDWSRTTAWGEGGYYARIFFNVRGREPQGCVAPGELESFADQLSRKLRAVARPDGTPMATSVYRPETIYRTVRNVAPDLMVYFDDLHWRAVGSVGGGTVHTFENDTGPDDANHAQDGIYIEALAGEPGRGRAEPWQLLSMADRFLAAAGVTR